MFLFLRQGLYISLVEAASLFPVLGLKAVATTHLAKETVIGLIDCLLLHCFLLSSCLVSFLCLSLVYCVLVSGVTPVCLGQPSSPPLSLSIALVVVHNLWSVASFSYLPVASSLEQCMVSGLLFFPAAESLRVIEVNPCLCRI